MSKSAKIAISLPQELLKEIERESGARGVTRSEYLRRAVEAFLRREREREAIEQYIRGYQQYPETTEEIALAESTTLLAMAENPWEGDEEQ